MRIIYKYIFAGSVLDMSLHFSSAEIATVFCLFAEIDIYVYSCIYISIMNIYYLEYIYIYILFRIYIYIYNTINAVFQIVTLPVYPLFPVPYESSSYRQRERELLSTNPDF